MNEMYLVVYREPSGDIAYHWYPTQEAVSTFVKQRDVCVKVLALCCGHGYSVETKVEFKEITS